MDRVMNTAGEATKKLIGWIIFGLMCLLASSAGK
jgi:hypothetical protein